MTRRFFREILWVHRCVACQTVLLRREPLCPDCRKGWSEAREWECGICGNRLDGCTCPAPYLHDTARVRRQIKLVRYRTGYEEATESQLIYRLKHRPSKYPSQFVAEELAPVVTDLIRPDGHYCVTNVPRTPKEEKFYGFDHARRVAEKLAPLVGVPYAETMHRARGAKVQKEIPTREERLRSVKDTYIPVCGEEIRGKRVLLVDDVVTTGATMAECSRVLKRAGAKEVVPVSVAIVAHNPGTRNEEPVFRKKR